LTVDTRKVVFKKRNMIYYQKKESENFTKECRTNNHENVSFCTIKRNKKFSLMTFLLPKTKKQKLWLDLRKKLLVGFFLQFLGKRNIAVTVVVKK
jgi:hypothetical protein